jgi:D-3-phosphoglycerate dehydrogenase
VTHPPARWKVLITAPRACQVIDRYRDELGSAGCALIEHPAVERLSEDELLPLVGDVDGIVCGDDRITARVLDAAPRLKVIAKWGTGIDSIDLEGARNRGVQVCNTPGAFTDPVADSVLGYVLLFTRRLDAMTSDMREGRWERQPLRAMRECTLGIIGFGNIGRAVARRATAFGMRVLAFDIRPLPAQLAVEFGVELVAMDRLLSESDFITLHADLRPDSRHLIDAVRLARVRPSAVLINTARGGLVDECALLAALKDGRIAGAALDVFEDEPLPMQHPLRQLPNVYLSPHNANASPSAAERVHANTISNLLRWLEV